MARPIKRSIDYFSFDTVFFEDEKIKLLKARHGADGVLLYIYLITYCYREKGYYCIVDEDSMLLISDAIKIEPGNVGLMIEFMIDKNLFNVLRITESKMILTSERIQKNYMAAVKSRGKKVRVKVDGYIWRLSAEQTEEYMEVIRRESFKNDL